MSSALVIGLLGLVLTTAPVPMVTVPAGSYQPFFKDLLLPAAPASDAKRTGAQRVSVHAFMMDVHAVTNEDFLAFVSANPSWQRSHAPKIFVDQGYLAHWSGDLQLSQAAARAPVTEVSWFAARAYCKWTGKRLPTSDEWEYAAHESGKAAKKTSQRILAWYGRPTPDVLVPVGTGPKNRFGLRDMHALVWEWTLDFNNEMTTGEAQRPGNGIESVLRQRWSQCG